MRVTTLLTTILGLTQAAVLPMTSKSNNAPAASNISLFNDTLPTLNTTIPTLMKNGGKPPHNWPSNLDYKPTSDTKIKVLRFKGKKCKIPRTLQHEEQIDIAPEGYENDPTAACKGFKKGVQSLWFQLPDVARKEALSSNSWTTHYTGPLHHCNITIYEGHSCDGREIVTLTESDEEVCTYANGGHSMRAACWK